MATAVIGILLHRQYVFFKDQANQLNKLHGSYARQICLVKRIIADTVLTLYQDTEENVPTGTDQEQAAQLLRQSLVTYLKEKGLGVDLREVEHVYRSYDDQLATNQQATHNGKTRRNNRRSIKKQHPLRSRLSSLLKRSRTKRSVTQQKLFAWPLMRGTFKFSSFFGKRRRPNGSWGFHAGLDMATKKGTPVRTAADGRVIEATYSPTYGNTILIEHMGSWMTRYAHLCSINVTAQEVVKKGQVIGGVGNTGAVRSSRGGDGTHLHFEIHRNGRFINPLYVLN